MLTLKVAGLTVRIEDGSELLIKRGRAYQIQSCDNVDIDIHMNKDSILKVQKLGQDMSFDKCNYLLSGEEFYKRLLDFGGFMLHASAVAVDHKAYLFSAESGTGKSTHTSLWQRYLGEDRAVIINDDKPAIRLMEDVIYCCGTPWSGKKDMNANIRVPIQGIVFIERSPVNEIRRIEQVEAIKLLLQNTLRPREPGRLNTLLGLASRILREIPTYRMGCNMEVEAAILAYQALIRNTLSLG